jgi:hypothetical protein
MKNACSSLIEKLEASDNLGDQDVNVRFKVHLKGMRCKDEIYLVTDWEAEETHEYYREGETLQESETTAKTW